MARTAKNAREMKTREMKIKISVLRRADSDAPSYWQSFLYELEDRTETVAAALARLNENKNPQDINGNPAPPIQWECGCLQKKCGACAMVINGRPALACDAFLYNYIKKRGGIRLEPLRKFPVIADLITDRSVLHENLRAARVWLEDSAVQADGKAGAMAYEASRCLQCGCCLEVCPNFEPSGELEKFMGMSAAVPMARLLIQARNEQRQDLAANYRKYIYDGCGKSLSCRDICPAGIDMDGLLSRSGAAAVWGRFETRTGAFGEKK